MFFKNAAITFTLLSLLPISTIQGCELGVECGLVYGPVCGEDGVTYGNPCEAERAGIINYTINECEEACPEVYEPVCGEGGVTYDNSCFAEKAGVENYTEGECAAGGASCEYVGMTLADGESVCDNPGQFTACDDGALLQGECAPDATCVEAGGIAECVSD